MIKVSVIILFIVMLFFSAGCGDTIGIDRRLDQADGLMWSAPDSALRVLDAIDPKQLSDGQQARRALLAAKAADKAFASISDPASIAIAADYYTGHADSLEVQSLYYLGQAYSLSESTDTALVMFHEAFDKAQAIDGYFYAAMSAREIAAIYGRMLVPGQQLIWARKARSGFGEAGKPTHAAWMDLILADALVYCGEFSSAYNLLDSLDLTEYSKNRVFKQHTSLIRAALSMQTGSYTDVLSIFDNLGQEGYALTAHDRLNQAKASLALGKVDDAVNYLSLAGSLSMSEPDSLYAAYLDGQLMAANRDFGSAYSKMSLFADKLMTSDARRLSHPQTELLIDNYRLQSANHQLMIESSRDQTITLILICVLFIMLSIAVLFNYRSRLARKMLEIDQLLLEADALRSDLTFVNSQYKTMSESNKSLNNSFLHIEANFAAEIRDLFSHHLILLNDLCEIWFHHRDAQIKNDHLRKELNTMLDKMGSIDMSEKLVEIINRNDNGWYTSFRNMFPKLNDADYKLAIYLYLGFRPSTIAVLTHRPNTQAVHNAKHKLKKKLIDQSGGKCHDVLIKLDMDTTGK